MLGFQSFSKITMKILLFIAIQLMILNIGETKENHALDIEEKEKRFLESNVDGKQSPVLWMIFNQMDKLQSKVAKVDHVNDEIKQVKDIVSALQKSFDNLKSNMGSTYIRFGKSKCTGSKTETVYKGQVGGSHYTHPGSGVNYLCLPNDPNIGEKLSHPLVGYLYGAEYELFSYNKPAGVRNGIADHDVPCAVCNAKGKTMTLMIPGRKHCYKGWKREYEGYLMSGYYGQVGAGEYVCVDKSTEVLHGGHANHNGKLFYPVSSQCGSLHCPPYENNRAVLCVVCSK